MPKRDGIDVVLIPPDLPHGKGFMGAWSLYTTYQLLDNRKDIERDRNITFRVGPKEWKQLEVDCHRSRQTIKRWQKQLAALGWITVELQADGSELVTLHADPKK